MKRTQIYLPEQLYEQLLKVKSEKGISVAEVIRRILEDFFYERPKPTKNLADLAELNITGGPKDLSRNFSKYLSESK